MCGGGRCGGVGGVGGWGVVGGGFELIRVGMQRQQAMYLLTLGASTSESVSVVVPLFLDEG